MSDLRRTAEALARHRRRFEPLTRPATDWLLSRLPAGATEALDLGCGIGDPTLSLAARLGGSGRVTAIDRVVEFLAELRAEADRRGLGTVSTVAADMTVLPLPSARYDLVVSKVALQFAPDAVAALREALRVLAPAGAAAFVVWGDPGAPLVRLPVLRLLEACGATPFEVGRPGPFRFSAAGSLGAALDEAGFVDVEEGTLGGAWTFPGRADELLRASLETSAPLLEPWLERLSPGRREETLDAVARELRLREAGGAVALDADLRWATGRRP